MKAVAYVLLLLYLPACRLSQPPVVVADSEALTALAASPAAGASSAAITIADARPADLAAQLPASLPHMEARQRRARKTTRPGPYARLARVPRVGQRIVIRTATTAANEPGPRPAAGFILVGLGAAVALASLLIVQNATTFGSALILGFFFGLGIALLVAGLLFVLFSYLLALYEKRQLARVSKPKE